jgi:hypothetical protein
LFIYVFDASRPGADFPYIFSGENFRENSAENFPPTMLGKNGIFHGKSFEKLFSKKFRGIFHGKMYEKSAPGCILGSNVELTIL